MNGPEHYRKAESLLKQLQQARTSMTTTVSPEKVSTVMAEAQVHATLALAAATALNDHDHDGGGMPIADYRAWRKTAGLPYPTCSQCDREVSPGKVYCSTICRNLDDRHTDGEAGR